MMSRYAQTAARFSLVVGAPLVNNAAVINSVRPAVESRRDCAPMSMANVGGHLANEATSPNEASPNVPSERCVPLGLASAGHWRRE